MAIFFAALLLAPAAVAQRKPNPKLAKPQRLDSGIELRRDPTTGELRLLRAGRLVAGTAGPGREGVPSASTTIRVRVNLVEVSCNVLEPDGGHLRGLGRNDFRIWEDGVEQQIAHFDASNEPGSVALLMDSSPSVYRDLQQVKEAARTLVANLSPVDEVAVVAFAAHTHLLLPFSRDRALLARAIASIRVAREPAAASGSNIYAAVYLTARELFGGRLPRRGRKAIVLLTDGQDSGLGLSWDPSSAMPRPVGAAPQPGERADRLTFEDVCRALTAVGVEVYAVSTENRPKAMTDAWLATHENEMLVTRAARERGMAHYTLYLAELVRRAGGRLYFLRELGTLSAIYRRIAENLRAQYTLGYYPSSGTRQPGWRSLRVEVKGRPPRQDVRITHRVAYYVPAEP